MLIDILVTCLGLLLVALVLHDFIATTLRLEGSGRISEAVMVATWRAAVWAQSAFPGCRLLPVAGVAALLTNIVVWWFLLWLGWLLLFVPYEGSVLARADGTAAGFWGTAYFVGFSLITLGVGDYVPSGAQFQLATVLAAVSGFFLLTLSITYLIPVVNAVVHARQLAVEIFLLGATHEEMVRNLLDPARRHSYLGLLQGLTGPLVLLGQRYFAYPVLGYFPSPRRSTSLSLALASLDEALTVWLEGQLSFDQSEAARLAAVRSVIGLHLLRFESLARYALPPAPAEPSLDPLRRLGIETVSDEEFGQRVARLGRRRSHLRKLLQREGRDWSEIAEQF